jgi:soluble P-type ATPase
MKYQTSEWEIELNTIFLNLNGTLTLHGELDEKVKDIMKKILPHFRVILLTWDIRWTGKKYADELWIELMVVKNSEEKAKIIQSTSKKENTIAIGNARIDIWMFKNAKLRIGTLQAEWIHPAILEHIDILIPSMYDSLSLLLNPKSLEATLKQ